MAKRLIIILGQFLRTPQVFIKNQEAVKPTLILCLGYPYYEAQLLLKWMFIPYQLVCKTRLDCSNFNLAGQ